ncbi:MAG TPA: CD225/dispanin family protein [Thermoanaerobaculia bacterium]
MNCPNCGTSNLDNAAVCVNCGRSLGAGAPSSYTPPPPPSNFGAPPSVGAGATIPNYLWQSIVVTLCCCLPLGIVSIIFAAQVNSKLAQGDVAGAQEASQKAKMFALIGFGVGLVIIILSMIFNGAVFMNAIREAQANR